MRAFKNTLKTKSLKANSIKNMRWGLHRIDFYNCRLESLIIFANLWWNIFSKILSVKNLPTLNIILVKKKVYLNRQIVITLQIRPTESFDVGFIIFFKYFKKILKGHLFFSCWRVHYWKPMMYVWNEEGRIWLNNAVHTNIITLHSIQLCTEKPEKDVQNLDKILHVFRSLGSLQIWHDGFRMVGMSYISPANYNLRIVPSRVKGLLNFLDFWKPQKNEDMGKSMWRGKFSEASGPQGHQ